VVSEQHRDDADGKIACERDVGIDKAEPGCLGHHGTNVPRPRQVERRCVKNASYPHIREVLAHPEIGMVGAVIVHYDTLGPGLCHECRKRLPQVMQTPFAGDDEADRGSSVGGA
jgi:hypothetical protein